MLPINELTSQVRTETYLSDFRGGLNGSSQHSRKACLQEFQNATFWEGIELTTRPLKRAKTSAVFGAEDSQGSHEATKPRVYKELPDPIVLHRPVEPAGLIGS